MRARTKELASGSLHWLLRRRWGMTALRANARHVLDRLEYVGAGSAAAGARRTAARASAAAARRSAYWHYQGPRRSSAGLPRSRDLRLRRDDLFGFRSPRPRHCAVRAEAGLAVRRRHIRARVQFYILRFLRVRVEQRSNALARAAGGFGEDDDARALNRARDKVPTNGGLVDRQPSFGRGLRGLQLLSGRRQRSSR